jgi:hypothetical protein
MNESVNANLTALTNAWHNFVVALAGPNSEHLISFLRSATGFINGMTAAVNKLSPEQLQAIWTGVAAFGAALIALGAISLVTLLGIPGLIAACVAGLIALASQVNWDHINAGLASVRTSINSFALVAWQSVVSVFDRIKNAIMSFISTLEDLGGKVAWMFGFGNNKVPGIEDHSLPHYRAPGDTPALPNGSLEQFKKDLDRANGSYVPMRFDPGERQQPKQQLALSLNIDGHTLAQAVSDQLDTLLGFSTSAPAPDGSGRWFSGDHNYGSV